MTRLAHLSDPHFGAEDEAAVRGLLADLYRDPPDVLLLTGDITQRARRGEFRRAAEFLAALPAVPRLVIPGNHDIPLFDLITRFSNPYRLYARHICPQLQPEYIDGRLAVLCVNATRRTRHINGVLSAGQIEATSARLRSLIRPFRLVATHQPLAAVEASDVRNLAHGYLQALESWITAGADLFLGGHIHLPYCVRVANQAGRGSLVLQAGTAVSTRTRGGISNSYNRIDLQMRDGLRHMRIERRDFDAGRGAFIAHVVHEARDTGLGWELGAAVRGDHGR